MKIRKNKFEEVVRMGIDTSKSVFHLHGVDSNERVVLKKQLNRKLFIPFLAQLPPCVIGIEACGASHYWARTLQKYGHTVKLMAAQHVKLYLKNNKNDARDAEAICEAVSRPTMNFVTIKTTDQQDVQSLHRVRTEIVKSRTALCNQIRGLLAEYGITFSLGISVIRKQVPAVLEDVENGLSGIFRDLLHSLHEALLQLEKRFMDIETLITRSSKNEELARMLESIPGIGKLSATALYAAVGTGQQFKNGRNMAAWLGLVPRQHSTGGKQKLLGISKKGNRYLRTLLISGAQSIIYHARTKKDTYSKWIQELIERVGVNKAAVAVANKNARIAWAVLHKRELYKAA